MKHILLSLALLLPTGALAFDIPIADTDTIDMQDIGGELGAAVVVDPAAGNALTAGPDGLFVAGDGTGTDNQALTRTGDVVVLESGGSVDLSDLRSGALTFSPNATNGTDVFVGGVLVGNIPDNDTVSAANLDNDPANEIQVGDGTTIMGDGTAADPFSCTDATTSVVGCTEHAIEAEIGHGSAPVVPDRTVTTQALHEYSDPHVVDGAVGTINVTVPSGAWTGPGVAYIAAEDGVYTGFFLASLENASGFGAANTTWADNPSIIVQMAVYINGVFYNVVVMPNNRGSSYAQIGWQQELAQGDTVELRFFQNSGADRIMAVRQTSAVRVAPRQN